MEKKNLWRWVFNLLGHRTDTPEPRKPMAVPNNPARKIPLTAAEVQALSGIAAMSEEEMREIALRQAAGMRNAGMGLVAGQANMSPLLPPCGTAVPVDYPGPGLGAQWEPGIEHSQPFPVKENSDGTLYYKGCVYRKVGSHGGRHHNKNTQQNKRRQG